MQKKNFTLGKETWGLGFVLSKTYPMDKKNCLL